MSTQVIMNNERGGTEGNMDASPYLLNDFRGHTLLKLILLQNVIVASPNFEICQHSKLAHI